ncbi:polyphosphate kinase 1 [Verticiella sediminum]|uniref:Polyphosphate kinase n=1 Tax=Verticiella sediminum TaxID=1247510 RepID=A0A556AIL0_9BURK|nr:polyphosphate kinase 1 [Verticiella sediminum]TSH92719.1 polyphosphate kinase 1 [Verticiella sediminum]
MSSRSPDPELFLNRELALLKFNERVLAQADNPATPPLERLRFLCIVGSNLDEFFEIRVSSLKEQLRQGAGAGADGKTPEEALQAVSALAKQIVARQYALLDGQILPQLRGAGVALLRVPDWNDEQRAWAREVFRHDVMPLLTPIALDPAHPFPRVYNKSLNFIVSLSGRDAFGRNAGIAIVQAPRALPRVLRMPPEVAGCEYGYTMLTSLMHAFVAELFPGMQVNGCYQWRVTRNSDLFVDEEEITNLRHALQGELTQRHFGDAVRLELEASTPPELERFLQREFGLSAIDTYRVDGPVNLSRLMQIANETRRPDLLFSDYRPAIPADLVAAAETPAAMFAAIAERDRLLHHPYQAFQPVIDFLTAAASDPNVVSIKQTIYRTGEDSELMRLLVAAARSGKEVTVVVELMARFDEQTNIHWAARLEEVGAHVVYGVVGHKTHAKMVLVLRREEGGQIRRYGHLGTGNYHPRTARLYTDFGLLTANRDICEDMDRVFSQLTGLGERRQLKALLQSPFSLHDTMVAMIRAEAQQARAGKRARIMAKMNSLLEPRIIEELYQASQAGVRIDLIVRGVCTLRPGVPGLSEKITVRSIVGRFLEHSRVYYFYNGGDEKVYLSSADWMDRNFFRRVEIAVPVLDPKLRKRVIDEAFTWALRDTELSWLQGPDGNYHRARSRRAKVNLHDHLMHLLGGV